MKTCAGIYMITVRPEGGPVRYYVGQSGNIRKRLGQHFSKLRRGVHWNVGLQVDFNAYGEKAFTSSTVLICAADAEILAMYEQAVVDFHAPDSLYNIRIQCVTSGLGTQASPERKIKVAEAIRGIKRSDETKAAIRRGGAWRHTPEGRAKMSAAHKGRKATPEQRAARSAAMKLRPKLSPEAYQRGMATRLMKKAVLQKGSAWILHG
jgi:group I intron endonuclease